MYIMEKTISVSMLSADFGHLERDTQMVNRSRAGWIHIDVMDGVFVPNISFGFPVLKAIAAATGKFIDTHLMIVHPERYIERFAAAGSSLITIHKEAVEDIHAALAQIRACGVKAGISIKPATPVSEIEDLLPQVDLVLVMSVEPGFGGQKFMPESVDKVRELRAMIDSRGLDTIIEIDGGINPGNAAMLFEAGCDVLVAGNAVFGAEDPAGAINAMLGLRA